MAIFLGSIAATSIPTSVVADDGERTVELFAGGPQTIVAQSDGLPPILDACLFTDETASGQTLTPAAFAHACVIPYINGLWLDPAVLYRSKSDIDEQARDKPVLHQDDEPFPIYYPKPLAAVIAPDLAERTRNDDSVVARPLPDPLPRPRLAAGSLYDRVGLLYLPNPYVVPGEKFNEMYGWDSYFIIRGLLATADYVMANPTAEIWSPAEAALVTMSADPNSDHYHRALAERLFAVAKGMVDNHAFRIEYYGGLILNANRTYYLTRSQLPLFAGSALAIVEAAERHGFGYTDTLSPYLSVTRPDYEAPATFKGWVGTVVLPAARRYYAYWTDPAATWNEALRNPRVATNAAGAGGAPVYLFGTDGVGPAPEVARSTQPQNRTPYSDYAAILASEPPNNPHDRFETSDTECPGPYADGGCGDPVYGLTQDFFHADRAIRASGFDLSDRFGRAGEWAMDYAPLSLNAALHRMAADIDRLAAIAGMTPPFGEAELSDRRGFLDTYFRQPDAAGYADRFIGSALPDGRDRFAYPYATQAMALWAGFPASADDIDAFLTELSEPTDGLSFLATDPAGQFGVPTSLVDSGKQWDAPFGWAPMQYFMAEGLTLAGRPAEAEVVMHQWVAAVNAFFAKTGLIIEKYDVRDPTADPRAQVGYARTQRGFGWSNDVYMVFANRLFLTH